MVLAIEDLSLEFEGLRALNGVSLEVPPGGLVALVGPNGAGKTSLLNCVSGFYAPTRGRITFGGSSILGLPPHRIAALGIARTFQFIELFRHMSVLDNVMLGRHRHMRGGSLAAALFWGRSRREEIRHRQRAEEVLEYLELERYRKELVASLPFGVQKLASLARALALEPGLILLDEPSTGMNRQEKEDLARFLLRLKHERGTAMLWVEHDMELVADLADAVTVVDFGQTIAAGPPADALRDPRVTEAYLGLARVRRRGSA
ncbi:MAG: ABC transporter ATP-binding protein [Candidatus Rokubacteria bacterium]|nr:ABC transporter ATP-binding protein [Candidatus Rokubacteria bacterium]